jgi:hypothetical protein
VSIKPGYDRQCHNDAKDALMDGLRVAISNEPEPNVQKCMIMQFRRIEKFFGYEPNTWRHFA